MNVRYCFLIFLTACGSSSGAEKLSVEAGQDNMEAGTDTIRPDAGYADIYVISDAGSDVSISDVRSDVSTYDAGHCTYLGWGRDPNCGSEFPAWSCPPMYPDASALQGNISIPPPSPTCQNESASQDLDLYYLWCCPWQIGDGG